MIGNYILHLSEPVDGYLRKHPSLSGYANRQNYIKCRYSVSSDKEEMVTNVINIPYLAAFHGKLHQGNLSLKLLFHKPP